MQERTQTWQEEALELSQVVDERLKELKKREVELLQKTTDPTTKALLKEVQQEENLIAETLQHYNIVYNGITTKIKAVRAE